ncbi:unnamed protein product [Owenia fusiformis]|uniref:Gamma-glutamylcyclotransferase AIG2-like domain-containing protein n=1 Tax=Owenia fusiformis TaxID=6347 RepID=A0A8S4NYW5_OWEFU|nr:unnamed protein product [Owenia fusiformis]
MEIENGVESQHQYSVPKSVKTVDSHIFGPQVIEDADPELMQDSDIPDHIEVTQDGQIRYVQNGGMPTLGRPRQDHEPLPFLSVDMMNSEILKPTSGEHVSRVSKSQGQIGMNTRQSSPGAKSSIMNRRTPFKDPRSESPLRSPSRSPTRFSKYVSPNSQPKKPNVHIKNPFKHDIRTPKLRPLDECPVTPSQDLKEMTALAMFHMQRNMNNPRTATAKSRRSTRTRSRMSQKHIEVEQEKPKHTNRLLKAKLRPLYPVKLDGPAIHRCKGIVVNHEVYEPPPNRSLLRRRQLLSNPMLPLSYSPDMTEQLNRPATRESIHRTSPDITLEEQPLELSAHEIMENSMKNIEMIEPSVEYDDVPTSGDINTAGLPSIEDRLDVLPPISQNQPITPLNSVVSMADPAVVLPAESPLQAKHSSIQEKPAESSDNPGVCKEREHVAKDNNNTDVITKDAIETSEMEKDTQLKTGENQNDEISGSTNEPMIADSRIRGTTFITDQASSTGTSQESRPVTGQGSRPITGQASRPATGQGSRPVKGQESRPTTSQNSMPNTGQVIDTVANQNEGQTTRPATGQGSRPTTSQGSRTANGQQPKTDHGPKPIENRSRPPTGQGSRSGTSQSQTPAVTGQNSRPPTGSRSRTDPRYLIGQGSRPGTGQGSRSRTAHSQRPESNNESLPNYNKDQDAIEEGMDTERQKSSAEGQVSVTPNISLNSDDLTLSPSIASRGQHSRSSSRPNTGQTPAATQQDEIVPLGTHTVEPGKEIAHGTKPSSIKGTPAVDPSVYDAYSRSRKPPTGNVKTNKKAVPKSEVPQRPREKKPLSPAPADRRCNSGGILRTAPNHPDFLRKTNSAGNLRKNQESTQNTEEALHDEDDVTIDLSKMDMNVTKTVRFAEDGYRSNSALAQETPRVDMETRVKSAPAIAVRSKSQTVATDKKKTLENRTKNEGCKPEELDENKDDFDDDNDDYQGTLSNRNSSITSVTVSSMTSTSSEKKAPQSSNNNGKQAKLQSTPEGQSHNALQKQTDESSNYVPKITPPEQTIYCTFCGLEPYRCVCKYHDDNLESQSDSEVPINTFDDLEKSIFATRSSIQRCISLEALTNDDSEIESIMITPREDTNATFITDITFSETKHDMDTNTMDVKRSASPTENMSAQYNDILESYRRKCINDETINGSFSSRLITPRHTSKTKMERPKSGHSQSTKGMNKGPNSQSKFTRPFSAGQYSDSGCESEVMTDELMSVAVIEPEKTVPSESLLQIVCNELPPVDNSKKDIEANKSKQPQRGRSGSDVTDLKVVANPTKLISRQDPEPGPIAPYPPLCFKINARPPPNYIYYFAYGSDMNPHRLSVYIRRQVDQRLWGLLYGFKLHFNKKGTDIEAGGFPNIQFNPASSVEGCLYLITKEELSKLDQSVGYPEHYEHVMLPVWMSNSREPDSYSVAQYCVPALMFVAQDKWTAKDHLLPCSYAVDQCLKSSDLLTPAYKQQLQRHLDNNYALVPVNG